jgi:hypothetical protein
MLIPVGNTFAIVDDDGITGDLLTVIATWRLGLHGYRASNWKLKGRYAAMESHQPQGLIYMHRLILELDGQNIDGLDVDHHNGNKLDNSRQNLRPATRSQNIANHGLNIDNTSGFKGVYWNKAARKWRARITVNNQKIHLGSFDDKVAAARAYDAAALHYFGAFARLNFPAAA